MRRWITIGAGAAAVLAAAAVATTALGDDDLPAPRTLATDPVPAERIHTTTPPGCGVTGATRDALTPHPAVQATGIGGSCEWASGDEDGPGLRLSVTLRMAHAGPGVPDANATGNSSEAAAITELGTAAGERRPGRRPVTGLGDEAFLSREASGLPSTGRVVFRTGNVTATVEYQADDHLDDVKVAPARLRDGALRAAADVARRLGAPAWPKIVAPVPAPRAVALRRPVCDLVPVDLRERLAGGEADPESSTSDPASTLPPPPGTRTVSCVMRPGDRELTVTVMTNGAAATGPAVFALDREYLRRYLDARAEPPISARDERYFHALSGLGDRAFCAYLEEGQSSGPYGDDPARIVARTGNALVSVAYGSDKDEDAEMAPLTREEAVNGAYAVARTVVGALER